MESTSWGPKQFDLLSHAKERCSALGQTLAAPGCSKKHVPCELCFRVNKILHFALMGLDPRIFCSTRLGGTA